MLSVLLNILILQQLVMPSEQQQQLQYACNFQVNEALQSLLFCNTSLSDDVRVRDLLDRMTLEEKITQLVNDAPAVPRLGIPSYSWWQEGLHGVAHVSFAADPALPHATSFPLPILTAASFNKTLWNQIGQACVLHHPDSSHDRICNSQRISLTRGMSKGELQKIVKIVLISCCHSCAFLFIAGTRILVLLLVDIVLLQFNVESRDSSFLRACQESVSEFCSVHAGCVDGSKGILQRWNRWPDLLVAGDQHRS